MPVGSLHAAEGDTKPGLRLFSCTLANLRNILRTRTWARTRVEVPPFIHFTFYVTRFDGTLQGKRHLLGHGPHKADAFTRDGHSDDVGVFALRHQALVALAQPDLGLPTDVLNAFGLVFEASLQMATHLRGRAVRPSAFDQHAARMGITGLRHPSLLAPLDQRNILMGLTPGIASVRWDDRSGSSPQFLPPW